MKKNSRCPAVRRRLKYGGTLANTRLRSSYELSDTITSGPAILQIGVALLLFSSLEGFAIPYFAVPKLGLSVHTLSALQGVLLLALGLLWPRLNLVAMPSRIAFWFVIYSDFA